MACRGAWDYLSDMEHDYAAANLAEIKRRLRENREWVRRWAAGRGSPNPAEMLRRNTLIREDEQFLADSGETDAQGT